MTSMENNLNKRKNYITGSLTLAYLCRCSPIELKTLFSFFNVNYDLWSQQASQVEPELGTDQPQLVFLISYRNINDIMMPQMFSFSVLIVC